MGLAPAGQIDRRVAVAVGRMPAATGEHAIGQCQIAANGPAFWAAAWLDGYQRSALRRRRHARPACSVRGGRTRPAGIGDR